MTQRAAFLAACTTCFAVSGAPAHGQIEGELSLQSSYIESRTFNDRFSDRPIAQLSAAVGLGSGVYVEPYIYTGFSRPMIDEGSEYGVELGWEGPISTALTASMAVGRSANYQGRGSAVGDWYARAEVRHGKIRLAVSILSGESDTLILNGGCDLNPSSRVTVTPTLAYIAAEHALNPGVELMFRLTDGLAFSARAVAPERSNGRHVFGSFGFVWSFSSGL